MFKRYLILTHRYVGIPLSLVFVVWFLSGFVMLYTGGMPGLSDSERLSRTADLDLSAVRITPAQAVALAGRSADSLPELRMLYGRPFYQIAAGSLVGIYADSGELLRPGGIDSQRLVAGYLGVDESLITREAQLEESDQWTLGLRNRLPLQKFLVADGEGSQVYVSAQQAVVVLHTTRLDRLLAWAGAIPHWFYLETLRERPQIWARSVVWTATMGCVFTVLGLILLFTQWRKTRPFNLRKAIPYRGLHRWHYVMGGLFGVVTLTWTFSGLLSMEPYAWTNETGYRLPLDIFSDSTDDNTAYDAINTSDSRRVLSMNAGPGVKKMRFINVLGQPFLELQRLTGERGRAELSTSFLDATTLEEKHADFAADELQERLAQALLEAGDGVKIVGTEVLDEYDSYYYQRHGYGGVSPPLPVLKFRLNDAAETWYYVDMNSARFVYQNHRLSRLERWLYNGLHSLDFSFWYQSRPLWDLALISLLLGGLALSGLGGYLGIRRLLARMFHQ